MYNPEKIIHIVKKNVDGLDALTIIPVIDLGKALKETIARIDRGLIPKIYNWTEKKTEFAYRYKNYRKWAKSILIAAKYYYTDEEEPDKSKCYGKIAKYTWRNNYQYLINKLNESASILEKKLNIKIKYKALSNYTSIPEKVLFNLSGLGKIGKNSVLITPRFGSYFVIGELLMDIEIDFDAKPELIPPDFSICGSCTKCIDACPTNAIIDNGVLDVNRCLQFISENLLFVEEKIREKWGNRLYGCSTCLDVCPYNQNLIPSAEKHTTGFVGKGFDLLNLLEMNEQQWREIFSNNQIGIKDRLAIIKNAILSIGNLKCREAKEALYRLLNHENEIIRAYAVWALSKIDRESIKNNAGSLLQKEKSEIVKNEIKKLL